MIWVSLIAILTSGFLYVVFFGAPYLPTRQADVKGLLKLLPITPKTVFYDLGCGDGKILLAMAKRGAQVVGYELNIVLWLISKYRLRHYRAQIYLKSFWRADLARADYVYCFLINHFMTRLDKKLKAQLKPGSYFISYVYQLPDRQPDRATATTFLYKF